MSTLASLIVGLGIDIKEYQKGLDAAQEHANSFTSGIGGVFKGLGTVALGGAVAGIGALGGALFTAVANAQDAQDVMAQTQAVIKSTGGSAGLTAQEMGDLASSLSSANGLSRAGDEAILTGENLLATFTEIKGGVFKDATATMVDMAQALGTDVSGGAIQLGKALNDPIQGISALTRVGVTFSDKQKALIKKLQETGDMAGAQKVILAELNKEFGGSAAAAAKTFGGQLDTLKDKFGEMLEGVGNKLLPKLTEFIGFLNSPQVQDGINAVVDAIVNGVGVAFDWLVNTGIPAVESAWLGLQPTFVTIGDVIQNVIIPIFSQIVGWLQTVLPQAIAFVTQHSEAFKGALIAIGAVLAAGAIIAGITAIVGVIATIASPIGVIIAVVGLLGAAWSENWGDIQGKVSAVVAFVKPYFDMLVAWLSVYIPVAIEATKVFFETVLIPAAQKVGNFIVNTVIPILKDIYGWLATNVPSAIKTLADFWSNTLQPALSKIYAFISNALIPVFVQIAKDTFTTVGDGITTLTNLWNNTLKPALNAVWSFINTYLIPIFVGLDKLGLAVVKLAATALATVWVTTLKPALDAVWSFIDKNVIPILNTLQGTHLKAVQSTSEGLAAFWKNTLQPALSAVWSFIDTKLSPVINFLANTAIANAKQQFSDFVSGLEAVRGVIDRALGWIQSLIDKLNAISVPDVLAQHSPSMLEQSLLDVGNAFIGATDASGAFNDELKNARGIGITGAANSSITTGGGSTAGKQFVINIDARGSNWTEQQFKDKVLKTLDEVVNGASNADRFAGLSA